MEHHPVYRKENIVMTAIDLAHEFGVHLVSTKEIANRIGIAESAIFKLFPKKHDLLAAALDQFAQYDKDIFYTAQDAKRPHDALLFYIDVYMTYYENYPAITALIQPHELFRGIPELEDRAKAVQLTRWDYMRQLIYGAQGGGLIDKDYDTERLADIFTYTFTGMCVKWRLSRSGFSLREETRKTFEMLIDSFKPKSELE